MDQRSKIQIAAAVGLLIGATALTLRNWRANNARPLAYFYDISKGQLFTADANLIPPIRGVDGDDEDGVKAVVIAPTPEDTKNRKIAYLERYSPELKADMEQARKNNSSPMAGRAGSQALRFVRRVSDRDWFSVASPEGQRIVSEWTAPGPDGLSPVVCTP